MLFLGHMGIGKRIARPWSKDLPISWLVLGTILPDVIDKPLYYGLAALTGRHGLELGLISGTRTLGHTLILVLVFALFARQGSLKARAVAIGMSTHLALDFLGDLAVPGRSSTLLAALFPLLGWRFDVMPFESLKEHLIAKLDLFSLSGEVIGALLLLRDWFGRAGATRN